MLAVWLSIVIVVSLFFVPAVAADPPDDSPGSDAPGQNKESSNNSSDSGSLNPGNGNNSGNNKTSSGGSGGGSTGSSDANSSTDGSTKDTSTNSTDSTSNDSSTNTTDDTSTNTNGDTTSDSSDDTTGDTESIDDGSTTTSTDDSNDDVTAVSTDDTSVDYTATDYSSDDTLDDSPEFDADGADELDRFHMEPSDGETSSSELAVIFEVSKEDLQASDTDLEAVTLYAFIDGEWVPLETEAVGETESAYVFRADSPHVSEFAVGALRPSFDLWAADVERQRVATGEPVVVTGRFSNEGRADGVYTVELVVDGRTVERKRLTIASGGTRQANFHVTFDRPGDYQIRVNGVSAGTVTVHRTAGGEGETSVWAKLSSRVGSPSAIAEWVLSIGRYAATGVVFRSAISALLA